MNIMRWFTCPICHGDGGWTEVIDPEIGGPYYHCEWCKRTGRLNLWQWLKYMWWKMRGEW